MRSARVPITAKVVADLLSTVGIDRVLTCDLHAEQIQGFFDVPVDNVFGSPVLLDDILKKTDLVNPIVVSPDIGGDCLFFTGSGMGYTVDLDTFRRSFSCNKPIWVRFCSACS